MLRSRERKNTVGFVEKVCTEVVNSEFRDEFSNRLMQVVNEMRGAVSQACEFFKKNKIENYFYDRLFDFFILDQEDLLLPCREKIMQLEPQRQEKIKKIILNLLNTGTRLPVLLVEFSEKKIITGKLTNPRKKRKMCSSKLTAYLENPTKENKVACEESLATYQKACREFKLSDEDFRNFIANCMCEISQSVRIVAEKINSVMMKPLQREKSAIISAGFQYAGGTSPQADLGKSPCGNSTSPGSSDPTPPSSTRRF